MRITLFNRAGATSLLVAGGLALALLYFRFDPGQYPFPRCPVNWLTGWYCPGCGTQRALHALLHGRPAEAAGLNLLAVICLPLVVVGGVQEIGAFLRPAGRRRSWLYRPGLSWGILVLTGVFTVLRNLPGAVGIWLAP